MCACVLACARVCVCVWFALRDYKSESEFPQCSVDIESAGVIEGEMVGGGRGVVAEVFNGDGEQIGHAVIISTLGLIVLLCHDKRRW